MLKHPSQETLYEFENRDLEMFLEMERQATLKTLDHCFDGYLQQVVETVLEQAQKEVLVDQKNMNKSQVQDLDMELGSLQDQLQDLQESLNLAHSDLNRSRKKREEQSLVLEQLKVCLGSDDLVAKAMELQQDLKQARSRLHRQDQEILSLKERIMQLEHDRLCQKLATEAIVDASQ